MANTMSAHQLELAMWQGMALGALAALPSDERAAFEAWERKHVDGSGRYATTDWPGFRRYIPPRPEAPVKPPTFQKTPIPRGLRREVLERDAYRCQECGTHLALTCDHIIPESKGGPTTLENLQTLCRPCNSRKGVT